MIKVHLFYLTLRHSILEKINIAIEKFIYLFKDWAVKQSNKQNLTFVLSKFKYFKETYDVCF